MKARVGDHVPSGGVLAEVLRAGRTPRTPAAHEPVLRGRAHDRRRPGVQLSPPRRCRDQGALAGRQRSDDCGAEPAPDRGHAEVRVLEVPVGRGHHRRRSPGAAHLPDTVVERSGHLGARRDPGVRRRPVPDQPSTEGADRRPDRRPPGGTSARRCVDNSNSSISPSRRRSPIRSPGPTRSSPIVRVSASAARCTSPTLP